MTRVLAAALLAALPWTAAAWRAGAAAPARSQPPACPPDGWSTARLTALKAAAFAIDDASQRRRLALALVPCLGDRNPSLRDAVAYDALSTWMRAGQLDRDTLAALRSRLLPALTAPDPDGFLRPFAALVLAEVARTDRVAPWMSDADRDALVREGAGYLAGVSDYRAFDDQEGFRHGVAHGADLLLQLALNPAVAKAQLDRMLPAIAAQVDAGAVAYWAGEPERLARPLVFIAQRQLHSEDEWRAFFASVTDPSPLARWSDAFTTEVGLRRRHNLRAFLLNVYAAASSADDPGIRALIPHATAALKAVP